MRIKIYTCAALAACALLGGEVELKRGKHAVLPADAFTVAIDVQPEAVRNGGIAGMVAWFGNGWDYGFRLRMSVRDYGFAPELEISKGKRNGSYVLVAEKATMPVGLKSHLAATWDGRVARIYLNGKMVAEGVHSGPLVRANGLNWGVGGPSYGLWGYPFATSGVRLWDSALSAAEVAELAKRVPVVPEAEVAAFVGQPINACVQQILAGTVDPRFEGLAKQRVFNAIFSGRDLQLSRELLRSFAGSVTNLSAAVAQDFRLRLASAALRENDVAWAEKECAALWNDACAAGAVYAPIAGLAYANVLARKGDRAKAAEVRAAAAARARPFLKPECSGEGVPPASTCVEPLSGRPAVEIHVAPDGNEDGDGSAAKPFASLVRARDAVRALKKAGPLPTGGVAVCLHGGVYRMSETLELGAEDSGEPGAPIVWRAWKDERPVLTGALDVPRFDAPLDPEVVRRLSPEARGHVVCADVRALGYTDTSPLHAFGFHRGEVGGGRPITDVYADAERLTLARFPNEGWLHIGEILDDSTNRVFKADIDLTPWADEPSLMLTGFWRHYWADLTEAPEKLDPATGLVTLGKRFNMVIQSKRPWFIVNAIHALDRPGEWWLDRPNGKLYLWPPKDARRFAMSLFDKPFFSLNGVRHFAVSGLVMERGRSAAVMARNCGDFHFTGNVVRDFGGEGVVLKNVRNASVCGNVLRGFGLGALRISGGDRKTLTASGVVVSDNDISWVERWKRTYAPGLHLDGCGTEVVHNHFHDMLSSAMRIEGNDHHVVSNIVERVVTESDDQGGIDIYANPSYAGIYIAFNVWRDIGCGGENAPCGQAGVRFDDAVSSMTVYCNYFENCSFSRFGCVQMNGGRNNTIDNNLFVNSPKGVSAGQWGQDRWHAYFKRPNVVRWTEEETSIRKPPYSEKYPGIAQLPEMGPVNYLTRNVVVGPGRLFTGSPQTVTYANRSFDDMPSAARLAEEPSFRPLPPESALGPRDVPSYRRACANDAVNLGVAVFVATAAAAAEFVSPQEKAPANGAAAVFEKSFANRGAIRRATWDVTAQGVFEAFANGRRVGNDFLKPGVTECGKCRHVYSYDVTDLLDRRAGATNVLSATVTPGWWCDQMMRPPKKVSDWQRGNKREWQLGEEIAFRGELRMEFDDGSAQTVGTDESWLAAYTGPLVSAGIYEGEVYDARRQVEGLKSVRCNTEFAGELRPAAAKIALREDLVLTPREMCVVKGVEGASKDAFGVAKVIRRYRDGEDVRLEPGEMLVIDFGQNCSAVPSFEVAGEAGAELKIRASEMLNESHGEKSRGNDGPAGTPYLAALRSAYAGIHYTLKDGQQSYMPRYTYFGYRYLGVTATRPVVFARWRSTPVSSVTREMERGRIVTGNARVNRLIANIRWGLLSNYLSSPTDCPQRDERMGWTADTQVFMNSAAYFADTSEFLGKYLADLRDAQRASGCYMCFVPNVRHTFPPWASAGWTDAGVIIPYRLWKWYGDRRFIDESWESMVRYMDFLKGNAEPYRINHGDWLAFEHHKKNAGDAMDGRQVKALNAYFRVWMAMLMREMAAATGRGAAERHYAEEEAKLRQAFTAAYVGPDGTIQDEYKGQCNDLYMLKLGLCGGAAAVEATKRDLIANIKACGNRLQTGFLGTAILMPTLTFEANAPELAYSLLLQDAFPSWLYSVDQGATTVWERWNGYTKEKGFGPVGMNSFNHYAYGCVAEWLFAAAAGIRQPKGAVGWKRFVLAPIPDKRLGSVDASFISPEGEIKSSWKYGDDGTWTWTFVVPKGTSAIVSAPGIPEREYGPGEWAVTSHPK